VDRYVYIAPHVLISDGPDGIATKLDQTFEQLELLDGGVVLFDEIDEIVLERDQVADESSSRLLTTAMLPRFQRLRSQDQLSFFVATNHVEKFDAAIRREGRFDEVIAVEYPDRNARELIYMDGLRDAILESAEARSQLIEEEKALVRRLMGPVKFPAEASPWLGTLLRLSAHQGSESWLGETLSDLHQETLEYRSMIQRARGAVALVRKQLRNSERRDNAQLDALLAPEEKAFDHLNTTIESVLYGIQTCWHCSSAVWHAAYQTTLRTRTYELRVLLESWAAAARGGLGAWQSRFEVLETARCCVAAIGELLEQQTAPEDGCSASRLRENLKNCRQQLAVSRLHARAQSSGASAGEADDRASTEALSAHLDAERPPGTPTTAGLVQALDALIKASESPAEDAHTEWSSTWVKVLEGLQGSLIQFLRRFPLSVCELKTPLESAEHAIHQLSVASASPLDEARAELLRRTVKYFGSTTSVAADELQCAAQAWQRSLDALSLDETFKSLLSGDEYPLALTALAHSVAEVDRFTRAWWFVYGDLRWLIKAKRNNQCLPPGFLIQCDRFEEFVHSVSERGGTESWRSTVASLERMPIEELTGHVKEYAGSLTVLHPHTPNESLLGWIWRYSSLNVQLAQVVKTLFKGPWRADADVPCRTVPWPLPRSDQDLAAGEQLTRKELSQAAKRLAKRLGLDTASGIHDAYASDMPVDVHDWACHILADMARESQFYREAEEYLWRASVTDPPDREEAHLHPRLAMPALRRSDYDALREFPILLALRMDAENDPKLCRFLDNQ
jgi:hypothetical protein